MIDEKLSIKLASLWCFYRKIQKPDLMDLWFSPLISELSLDEISIAIDLHLKGDDCAFFPMPGHLIKLIRSNKKQNGFYDTPEWKQLRYSTIVKHGRKCMACGDISKQIHVDHIKPRSKFPELELDPTNLQILCEPCNMGKSDKDETDWSTR